MSKRFARHRVRRGVNRPRISFHSYRATVATKLENAVVPEIHAARLIGHKLKTMTYGLARASYNLGRCGP